jgi:hypothetical protein
MLNATVSSDTQALQNCITTHSPFLVSNVVSNVEQAGDTVGQVEQTQYAESKCLPLDTQKKMVRAIKFASSIKAPVQTMLTINAEHMQREGYESVFKNGHLWNGCKTFRELLNKWLTQRGITWACVWVREYTGGHNRHHGEHWHITFHLPPKYQTALADQVAIWSGENIGESDGSRKCIARSLSGAWYLSKCRANAADYLGKATPRTRTRYGKQVPNQHRKTRHFGGEGPIQGKRFGISRPIGDAAQRAQGWK